MKKITLTLIKIYKIFLSGALLLLFGRGCRFFPTCSEYAKKAIERHGITRGSVLTLKRVSRCHPFSKPQFDPVP